MYSKITSFRPSEFFKPVVPALRLLYPEFGSKFFRSEISFDGVWIHRFCFINMPFLLPVTITIFMSASMWHLIDQMNWHALITMSIMVTPKLMLIYMCMHSKKLLSGHLHLWYNCKRLYELLWSLQEVKCGSQYFKSRLHICICSQNTHIKK